MNTLYLHLVFSTQANYPFIDRGLQEDLFDHLRSQFSDHGCKAVAIGGYTEHVHILLSFHPNLRISVLIAQVKSTSTRWVRKRAARYHRFSWQAGYSAFTVSPHRVHHVERFILHQERNHQTLDFEDEMAGIIEEAKPAELRRP